MKELDEFINLKCNYYRLGSVNNLNIVKLIIYYIIDLCNAICIFSGVQLQATVRYVI